MRFKPKLINCYCCSVRANGLIVRWLKIKRTTLLSQLARFRLRGALFQTRVIAQIKNYDWFFQVI